MYIKSKNGQVVYPYTLDKFKRDNPNISFPSVITNQLLAEYGVYEVHVPVKPTDTLTSSYFIENTPTQDSSGTWVARWVEQRVDLATAISAVRTHREVLLKNCDWTQLPDSPLSDEKKAEWATYRQALRDITADSDFPYSITWPTEP